MATLWVSLLAKLGLEGLTLDVATYQTPEEEDEAGTADAIRLVHSKLTANKYADDQCKVALKT